MALWLAVSHNLLALERLFKHKLSTGWLSEFAWAGSFAAYKRRTILIIQNGKTQ